MSARKERAALADLRALEEQAERANPIAPSTKRKAVKGAGATPSMGLSQFRGGRTRKMPSLKVEEKKMTPSLHNAMEDEMALMPSGEYDGAGKHTLLDHLASPMKGFGDYLHAFLDEEEAPAIKKAKKVLPGARRKGGINTGKYEGEGATPSLGLSQFRGGMDPPPGGEPAAPAEPAAAPAAAGDTARARLWVQNRIPMVRDAASLAATLHAAANALQLNPAERAWARQQIADRFRPSPKSPPGGEPRVRGGMAVGQVVGSGKLTITHGDESDESDEEMEGCGPAPVAAPKGKKKRAPAGPDDGRRKRAAVVKKVMAEKGLSMIQASKYVKEHGLY